MSDFLNPKSMMTPGMAGGVVMFVTNAICYQFPDITPRWSALLLSFVIGGIVVGAAKLEVIPAAAFWCINSLIIFAVSVGSAGVAARTSARVSSVPTAAIDFLMPKAYGQTSAVSSASKPNVTAEKVAVLRAQLNEEIARLTAEKAKLAQVDKALASGGTVAKWAELQFKGIQVPHKVMLAKPKAAKKKLSRHVFFKNWLQAGP